MEPGSISSEVVRGGLFAAYGGMSPGLGPRAWECNENKNTPISGSSGIGKDLPQSEDFVPR